MNAELAETQNFQSLNIPLLKFSKTCFICLEGSEDVEDGGELIACCTQCYTVVHKNCWRQWRLNQKLSSLRARLLAQNCPDQYTCCVCKTGIAQLNGKPRKIKYFPNGNSEYTESIQNELLQIIGQILNNLNEDEDIEPNCCSFPIALANLAGLSFLVILSVLIIIYCNFQIGKVILWALYVIYICLTLEFLILYIIQRQFALGPLANRITQEVPCSPEDSEIISQNV